MKRHPYQGYLILSELNSITDTTRQTVLFHHERSDGSGYPKRMKNSEIPYFGKITAIADTYDALSSERPYKKAKSAYDSLRIMKNEMSAFFDEQLFERFVKLFT